MCALKLDTNSYKILGLEKKYLGFHSPAFKVLINGTDIVEKENMAIGEILVENSIDKASFFSFSVLNAYEFDKSSFKWNKDYLIPGNKIEIKFGYVDKFVSVFEGYITSIKYDFSLTDGTGIFVYGMDASFLMMKGKKSDIWLNKKHSDIVSEIAGRYSLSTEVQATSMMFPTVVQNQQTDYDFLKYLSNLNSFEMFVFGSTLYFRKINSDKSSSITLEIYKHISEFNYSVDIGEQIGGVVVRGYNIKKEEIEAKSESVKAINSSGKSGVTILGGLNKVNTTNYIHEPLISKEEAKERAESFLTKKSMEFITGRGSTIGIPEISAGRYLDIKGAFGTESRTFYVLSATHVFDSTGYTTYFKFGGNSI